MTSQHIRNRTANGPSVMARGIATVVFSAIALVFIGETAFLIEEFGEGGLWFTVAALYSQNFFFWPIAGLAVLAAFWRPTAVLVDLYLTGSVPGGPIRFGIGLTLIIASSIALGGLFAASPARSVFEAAPAALQADAGLPAGCAAPGSTTPCARMPILAALADLRAQAQTEEGLSPFVIDKEERLAEGRTFRTTGEALSPPHCFVLGRVAPPAECLEAKHAFGQHLNAMAMESPSRAAFVHRIAMPVKIFFLLMLLAIGLLLARRRKRFARYYPAEVDLFALPVLIAAMVMIIWPLLNNAHIGAFGILFGSDSDSMYAVLAPLYSLVVVVWALMILFFYLRHAQHQAELAIQSIGLVGAGIGIVQYDDIVNYAQRTLGAGADVVSLTVFAVGIALLTYTLMTRDDDEDPLAV